MLCAEWKELWGGIYAYIQLIHFAVQQKYNIVKQLYSNKKFYYNNGIVLSHRKRTKNTICSNMDGPRHCHTE